MNILIQNLTGQVKQLHEFEFQPQEIKQIDTTWHRDDVIQAIGSGEFLVHNDLGPVSGVVEQLSWLKGEQREVNIVEQSELKPFALPTYRTKNDATAELVSVEPNTTQHIDYLLTEERYVSGGRIMVANAEFGDWVSACVYDLNQIIPEQYRSTLCENWPVVAKYIKKMWIYPNTCNDIDTRPLNAKISAGLALRVTYNAVGGTNTRLVAMNYNLTKKL